MKRCLYFAVQPQKHELPALAKPTKPFSYFSFRVIKYRSNDVSKLNRKVLK